MNNKYVFSGLGGNLFGFIRSGMKELAEKIDGEFHALPFGYAGWKKIADKIVNGKIKGQITKPIVLVGHSNGVYACLKIAEHLAKYKIKCVIISVDRTLKWCPPAGANVEYLMDNHARLAYVKRGEDFKGGYEVIEWPRPKGVLGSWHIGVSSDSVLHDRIKALLENRRWL